MLVQLLVDNPNSWIIPYVIQLKKEINLMFGFSVDIINKHSEVVQGEVLCLLSCEKIFKHLDLNRYNLVVHESDLPSGKGWSPVTWQVLEGKSEIPVTLFEASEKVDTGKIYAQEIMRLDGTELLPEIKDKQGKATIKLILDFLKSYPIKGKKQQGVESFYNKRSTRDSELDVNKTISEQFNLLRVCDNERYPAFFNFKGNKYMVKLYKENDDKQSTINN